MNTTVPDASGLVVSLLNLSLKNTSVETAPPNFASILDALLSSGHVPTTTRRLLSKDDKEFIDKSVIDIMEKASIQIHILATLDAACRAFTNLEEKSAFTNLEEKRLNNVTFYPVKVKIGIVNDFNNHQDFYFSSYFPEKAIGDVQRHFPEWGATSRLLHIQPASRTLDKFNQTFPGTSDIKLRGLLNSNDTWAPIMSNKYIGDHVSMMNRILYWFMMGVPINTSFEIFKMQFIEYLTDRCKLFEFANFGLLPEESFAYGNTLSKKFEDRGIRQIHMNNNCDLKNLMRGLGSTTSSLPHKKSEEYLEHLSQQQWKQRLTYIQIISIFCASKSVAEKTKCCAVMHVTLVEKEQSTIEEMVRAFQTRKIDETVLKKLMGKYVKHETDHLPPWFNWMLTFESATRIKYIFVSGPPGTLSPTMRMLKSS